MGDDIIGIQKDPEKQQEEETECRLVQPSARWLQIGAGGKRGHYRNSMQKQGRVANGCIGDVRVKPEIIVNPQPLIECPNSQAHGEEQPKRARTTAALERI